MPVEELVEVISKLGPTGHPVLGNCSLLLGDGVGVVQFVHGRARVPDNVAAQLESRTDVDVLRRPGAPPADAVAPIESQPQHRPPPAPVSTEEAERRREEARQYLEASGDVEADVPPFPIPAGFATHTTEGTRRCLAAKADGSQCANGVKDGWACGLTPHQAQLTPGVEPGLSTFPSATTS